MNSKYNEYNENAVDKSLDDFVHQRSRILNSKLEVLLQEIWTRLAIKNRNIDRINSDSEKLNEIMNGLGKRVYYLGNTPEKDAFQKFKRSAFDLERERREQDVSCWNDVVKVMQELMNTWEAHQQSAARARLMKSGGLEKILEKTYSEKEEKKELE